MVLPDKPKNSRDWWKHEKMYITEEGKQNTVEGVKKTDFEDFFIKGGHVEAYPGFYFKVLSFDARALYPSNIVLYNISPETKVIKPTNTKGLIKSTVNGVYYRPEKGILPTIIEESLKERDYHKALSEKYFNEGNKELSEYHNYLQMVFKINNNSAYGALCNKNFHLFDVDNARAITRGGRAIIRYLSKYVNLYLIEHLHKDYMKYFPDCKEPRKIESQSLITLLDTDSLYVTIDDIYDIYNSGESILEFSYKIEKVLFEPLLDKLVKRFAKEHNSNGSIYFKREGIISKQIVLGKKKYFTELLQKEGKIFKEPKPDATGLETEKSSFPLFCQEKVWETFEEVFNSVNCKEDLKNPSVIRNITLMVRQAEEEFKKASIEDISLVSSVQKYEESCKSGEWYCKNGLKFKSSLPYYYRAACVHNYVVSKYDIPIEEITGSEKIKYIYVYPNNITRNNIVAYIGTYPKEFEKIFRIDYETQFQKTYFSVLQRLFDVLKWGNIEMTDNVLRQFKRRI
jgi:DNA polymerase elongation subunit (family B)